MLHLGGHRKTKTVDTAQIARMDSAARVAIALPADTARLHDSVVSSREKMQKQQLIARITPLFANHIEYKTFSGKARVHIETPDGGNDFAAHFRIRKDSVIWVSVNLAGIPVARVFVTQDSIFMLDYYHKEAKCVPLSQIAKILPTEVSFKSLQNLVLGEPLTGGVITDAEEAGDSITLQAEDSSYIQRIVYNTKDSTMRNEHVETSKPHGPIAYSGFSNYEIDNGRRISANREVNVINNNAVYILEMYFSKIDFDEPLDYPFNIPKSYR